MTWSLAIVALLGANAYQEMFDNAARAYDAGDYAGAIQMYEQLIEESVIDPVVFYNLGNAYYRAGRIGPAIANYERALQLDPGFESAQENLDKAVRDTDRKLGRPLPSDWEQSLLFWHYSLPKWVTNALAAISWIALWVILGLRQWKPLRYTRRAATVAAVVALAFGVSAWEKAHPTLLAVANEEKVPVRYGPGESETVRFELFAGDRVTVDKRQNGWARVTTIDENRGWAPDKSLTFVGPPYERPAQPTVSPSP